METKKVSLIVSMTENHVIGSHNQLLWHLSEDLKHFKKITMGKPIIMGRKTFESIGKALPGRQNIILTRDVSVSAISGCDVVHSVDEVFEITQEAPEIMIIGGGEIYRLFLRYATYLYLTIVHTQMSGEVSFEKIDPTQWQEVSRESHQKDEKHLFDYSFIELKRI